MGRRCTVTRSKSSHGSSNWRSQSTTSKSGASGHLRLRANPSAFGGFLPGVLADYSAMHPNVQLDLEEALSEDAIRAVQKGIANVAIIGDNVPCEGLETFVCNVDRLVLLVPLAHVLAS